jgi:hypothetical protein
MRRRRPEMGLVLKKIFDCGVSACGTSFLLHVMVLK